MEELDFDIVRHEKYNTSSINIAGASLSWERDWRSFRLMKLNMVIGKLL